MAVQVLEALAPFHDTVVVQRWGGPLAEELATAAGTSQPEPLSRLRALLRRWPWSRPAALAVERLAATIVLRRHRPALLWLNTVLSACYIEPACRLGIPVVLHVHELEPLASTGLDRYRLRERLVPLGVRVVACSTAVQQNLAKVAALPAEQVRVIPSVPSQARVARLAAEGPSPDLAGHVVVSCGTADERKGVDVWLAAARLVLGRRNGGDVTFVWVGPPPPERIVATIDEEIRARVHFLGEMANPYPVIAGATVFTLLSRQDPFPLVVLEAMSLGRAVVVTSAGGLPEQVGGDGVVVPVEDAAAAAEAIEDLLGDPARRQRLGQAAARRAAAVFGVDRFAAAVVDTAASAIP